MRRFIRKVSHIYEHTKLSEVGRLGFKKLLGPSDLGPWEEHIRRLMERDVLPLLAKAARQDKRALFWTPMALSVPWQGPID